MSKELLILNHKEEPLDEFALKADPSHAPSGLWAKKMEEALASNDERAWIMAALCRLRRTRGLCREAEGHDCVIFLSSPVEMTAAADDPVTASFVAIGYSDPDLGAEGSVNLLWEDQRGERRWTALQDMRLSRMKGLEQELEKFFKELG